MNLDSLSYALSFISSSVSNLTKKNYRYNTQEVTRLVSLYGFEAERHLVRQLFASIDFIGERHSSLQAQYLSNIFPELCDSPRFESLIRYAVGYRLQSRIATASQFISGVPRVLSLDCVQEALFVFCIEQIQELSSFATAHLEKETLPKLESTIKQDPKVFSSKSARQLHALVSRLVQREPQTLWKPLLTSLKSAFPLDDLKGSNGALSSLFLSDCEDDDFDYDDSAIEKTMSSLGSDPLADAIRDVGYPFTYSLEECRNCLQRLLQLQGDAGAGLSPYLVARILGTMATFHMGQSDEHMWLPKYSGQQQQQWPTEKDKMGGDNPSGTSSWNVDVFVQAVTEVNSSLQWKDVIRELDYSGFVLRDRMGLKIVWAAVTRGLQAQKQQFPIEVLYRVWRNAEAQLSLFQQILKNADVACLADFSHRDVQTDILKAPPEDDNREVANWKCLELIEVLLHLSEPGHHHVVHELFSFPLKNCPDLLILGLIQCNPVRGASLRQDLITNLVCVFLGNHANSAIVLHYAWNCSNQALIRPLMMAAMAEWYLRGDLDQTRLSRILDVAHDLKALSSLLSGSAFTFVIDLACLASRREYLKLEKWLNDKINEHKEPFIQECVMFLKRRCPQIMSRPVTSDDLLPKSAQLTPETITTMLNCLHQFAENVSKELRETILTMFGNSAIIRSMSRQPAPGVVKTPRGLEPAGYIGPGGAATQNAPAMDVLASLNSLNLGSTPSTPGAGNAMFSSLAGVVGFPGGLNPTPAAKLSGAFSAGGATANAFANATSNAVAKTSYSGASELTSSAVLGGSDIPTTQLARDIEDEANGYFQRIYNHSPHPTLSVHDFIEMLKRFQASGNKRERDVFGCMIRNLFDEYRFFPNYPDKELTITAQLFGGIIEQRLLQYVPLAYALRYVLDALKKPANPKMFFFGITALDCFKLKLKDYPQYCQHLASSPNYHEFPEHIRDYIDYGARSMEPPHGRNGPMPILVNGQIQMPPRVQPGSAVVPASPVAGTPVPSTTSAASSSASVLKQVVAVGGKPSLANATNIDTLLGATEKGEEVARVTAPPEHVQDKIAFIINNLSQANLPQKTEEFRDLITEEHYSWVAQYLVMKRASIEPNFHSLYANFLDTLKSPKLYELVLRETFRNIKVLLRSDKELANFSDRALLKSLGHWLGLLTIAKNKPVLFNDIDLKALLVEAYHKGECQQELLYVVPFVAKVLEACARSRVFKPPNPWTMGILSVLSELHKEPGLKLNLKFEIEVLCKSLSLDLNDVKPATVLHDQDKYQRIEPQLSPLPRHPILAGTPSGIAPTPSGVPPYSGQDMTPDPSANFITNAALLAAQQHGAGTPTDNALMYATKAAQAAAAAALASAGSPIVGASPPPRPPQYQYEQVNIMNGVAGIVNQLQIAPSITLLPHGQLKQFLVAAVERAIQEWLTPVTERCLKIALTSCENLVKKDFALESDENKMRGALHNMVRSFTAGIAMVTCKDPLHMSINNYLKGLITQAVKTQQQTTPIGPVQKDIIDQIAGVLAMDNVEIVCCFIIKTVVEKALVEIDKKFANDYDERKVARSEGRRYYDNNVLAYQAQRMPEPIRLYVNGVSAKQMVVYEEFTRNIPGFASSANDSSAPQPPSTMMSGAATPPTSAAAAAAAAMGMSGAGGFVPANAAQRQLLKPDASVVSAAAANAISAAPAAQGHVVLFNKIIRELEVVGHAFDGQTQHPLFMSLSILVEAVVMAANDQLHILSLLQRTVENYLKGMHTAMRGPHNMADAELIIKFRDAHLLVLKALSDSRMMGTANVVKQVTRFVLDCQPEEIKYNFDALDALFRANLLVPSLLDAYLVNAIDNGSHYALEYARHAVRAYLIDSRVDYISEADLQRTWELLLRAGNSMPMAPGAANAAIGSGVSAAVPGGGALPPAANAVARQDVSGAQRVVSVDGIMRDNQFDDPPGLHEKTEFLLNEWVRLYNLPSAGKDSTRAFQTFVEQMSQQGILKTDDLITRFFRISTEMCVELCYRTLESANRTIEASVNTNKPQPNQENVVAAHQLVTKARNQCYHTLDAYVRLIALLVKLSGHTNNPTTKVNLLSKVLTIIAGVLGDDAKGREESLDLRPLPFYRMFLVLFLELSAPDPLLEQFAVQTLLTFANTYRHVNPTKFPGFAFAWLDLISHRQFLARMLGQQQAQVLQKTWPAYAALICELISFLAPYLAFPKAMQVVTIQTFYKGTLRLLLVLLHDFPEFLCEFHFQFCDIIPHGCVQMRNLILSASPRHVRLPDPFTVTNLRLEMLPEIQQPPRIQTPFTNAVQPIRNELDSYLKMRLPGTFLNELKASLLNQSSEKSVQNTKYNISMVNSLVLYVGTQAISTLQAKNTPVTYTTIGGCAHSDIFQHLAISLDSEGRYLLFNAMANQLRYPNSHTQYFSSLLLYLFAECNGVPSVQEIITRVLLERLVVSRPHPWGLLITFIELIKNSAFKFWNYDFVRCAPEFEKLFDSMARSCMPKQASQEQA